ncbi:hypothetical protein [Marinobacter salsuginis]|uniref:hypothetical protein n=1 Tax=Marinobacter salsuginis TaxID=418719 RepID=UPI001ADFA2A9|nr:hypothetical protein [Marinobacter salsuginis]QTN41447.1 hypothetical protein HZ997_17685 [Marinobacter salsuginis]
MIGQHRIFADHYQFYVFDSLADPLAVDEEWSEEVVKRGYLKGRSSIHIVTVGDYNDHAVSIHLGRPEEALPEGGHDATTEIKIESGKVKLSSPAYVSGEEPVFHVGSGVFELTIRSLNLGKEDPDAAEELDDRDFFKLAHLERYELYFAPKA